MQTNRILPSALVFVAMVAGSGHALGNDNAPSRPLVQATFDRLIPSAFPTVPPNNGRLRQVTFSRLIPSWYPTIQPDFSQLQQTTFNRMVPTSFPATNAIVVCPAKR